MFLFLFACEASDLQTLTNIGEVAQAASSASDVPLTNLHADEAYMLIEHITNGSRITGVRYIPAKIVPDNNKLLRVSIGTVNVSDKNIYLGVQTIIQDSIATTVVFGIVPVKNESGILQEDIFHVMPPRDGLLFPFSSPIIVPASIDSIRFLTLEEYLEEKNKKAEAEKTEEGEEEYEEGEERACGEEECEEEYEEEQSNLEVQSDD